MTKFTQFERTFKHVTKFLFLKERTEISLKVLHSVKVNSNYSVTCC